MKQASKLTVGIAASRVGQTMPSQVWSEGFVHR